MRDSSAFKKGTVRLALPPVAPCCSKVCHPLHTAPTTTSKKYGGENEEFLFDLGQIWHEPLVPQPVTYFGDIG